MADNFTQSTMRPGLLVSMRTSIAGNLKYRSNTIEDKVQKDGVLLTKWETTRTVFDPEEHAKAVKARSNVRGFITSVCVETSFGLLCPEDRIERLDEAVRQARSEAEAFNKKAKFSKVGFYIIAGRIAADDAEAFRAISSEVRGLMTTMEAGIKNMDANAIRQAATRARGIGQMLTPKAKEQVQEAIDMARAAARKIVKAGESAAQEVDHETIKQIAARRTAFLDLDDAGEMKAPTAAGRAVDFEPEGAKPATRKRVKVAAPAQIDLEEIISPPVLKRSAAERKMRQGRRISEAE